MTVVNFFTVSSYAPHSTRAPIPEISSVRAREDQRALAVIDPRIRVEALGLLDAPLRLNISAASISAPENTSLQPAGETESLRVRTQIYFARGLVLAPLALGNHIDHRAVHAAAVKTGRAQSLAFYEDLPYATWTSPDELAARVAETERATQVALKPIVVRSSNAAATKKRLVSRYQSQIDRSEAVIIARFSSSYGGGERIWVPKHGKSWLALTRQAQMRG